MGLRVGRGGGRRGPVEANQCLVEKVNERTGTIDTPFWMTDKSIDQRRINQISKRISSFCVCLSLSLCLSRSLSRSTLGLSSTAIR